MKGNRTMEKKLCANPISDEMSLKDYEAIYDAIVSLSCDAEGYGLFSRITDEDVEKCKWIAAILEVLDDVPRRRVEHIFTYKNIVFDSLEFIKV